MTKISDVTAFVFSNVDYWQELLAGTNYPPGLSSEEADALESARDHVERQVVELLHLCGAKLPKARKEVTPQNFKRASTAKNRYISIVAPAAISAKLYRLTFSVDTNENGTLVALYASLVVKKGFLDTLRSNLAANRTAHAVDDYELFAPSISMPKDASIEALADTAVVAMSSLLDGVR